MKKYQPINREDYYTKKLDTAKEILPILISQHSMDYITDVRKRASLIYNSVAIADELLDEVGFTIEGEEIRKKSTDEVTAIRKLSELLKEDKKK